jgi:DNA-binding transcriptional LysR family regulator
VRLRHIEVFNAVMVTGTASSAAGLLHMTQPAVTQILKSLELQLGYALFERTRGRLIPTNEAKALYVEVEKLDHQLDAVKALSRNLKHGEGGRLRILAAPALAQTLVPRGLAKFIGNHPRPSLSLQSQYSREIIESLALHEADVGIIYQSATHPVIVQEIVGTGYLCCASPARSGIPKRSVKLADLREETIFLAGATDPLGRLLMEACRERNVAISESLQVQQYHAALALVMNGYGMAVVDSFTALSADPKRVLITPIEPRISFQVNAAYAITGQRSHLAREFVRCLQHAAAEIIDTQGPPPREA